MVIECEKEGRYVSLRRDYTGVSTAYEFMICDFAIFGDIAGPADDDDDDDDDEGGVTFHQIVATVNEALSFEISRNDYKEDYDDYVGIRIEDESRPTDFIMTIEDHTDKVVLTVLVTDSNLVDEARKVVLEVYDESGGDIWWIELEIYIKQNQALAFVSDL